MCVCVCVLFKMDLPVILDSSRSCKTFLECRVIPVSVTATANPRTTSNRHPLHPHRSHGNHRNHTVPDHCLRLSNGDCFCRDRGLLE
jgi:hypothetical protein